MKLENRVAIVTGGAKGIGRATSLKLSDEGAKVVILDILEKEALHAKDEIERNGGEVLFFQTDITKEDQVEAAVNKVIRKYKRIDILVNNAGWGKAKKFVEMDNELRDKILNINLVGVFIVTKAVIHQMIKQNGGRIINVGSSAGRVGTSTETIYSAAKAGVFGFTKALAREVAKNNINVNCISPGVIDTDLLVEGIADTPRMFEIIKKSTPLPRIGKPEDIAGGILYLASDDASFITGQILSIDGGLTMV